jgi:hypothetical protein
MSNTPLIELLYAALREDLGVVVETNDVNNLRAKLYKIRSENLAEFECISLSPHRAAPTTHLLIVRRPNENGAAEAHPEPPQG